MTLVSSLFKHGLLFLIFALNIFQRMKTMEIFFFSLHRCTDFSFFFFLIIINNICMQEEIRFARNTCSRRWFVAYKIHVDSRFISKSCDRWWQVFALYMENRARILFTLLSTHAVLKLFFFLLTIRVEKLVKMIKRAKVICIHTSRRKSTTFVKRFIRCDCLIRLFVFFSFF